MRVLLVNAANPNNIAQSVLPPLGVLYLAAWLARTRDTDEVRLVDLQVASVESYTRLLREWSPQVVGISALTMEAQCAHRMAALAKQMQPDCRVVMGGAHPTGYFKEVLEDPHVDAVVMHEGEITFGQLLDHWERGADVAAVDGIAYRVGGTVQQTRPRAYIQNLDDLPGPRWDLIDFASYTKRASMSIVGGYRRVAPIFTSRACPYQCTYCHDMFGKRFQKRSVGNVLDELQFLVETHNIRYFEFVDDIFNLDRERARQILQGILDRNLQIRLAFPNGLRADLLTDDLIDLFAAAGTEYVCIAVETASPRLQKQIKKNLDLDKIPAVIRRFVDHRVFTNCFYMLGFPTETVEEMRQTVDFACSQPSHTALFFIVTPFQGTEISRQVSPTAARNFEEYSYYRAPFNLSENIPTDLLHHTARFAYFKFFTPRRIFRLLRDHPNRRAIWRSSFGLGKRILFDNLNQRTIIGRIRRLAGFEPAAGPSYT